MDGPDNYRSTLLRHNGKDTGVASPLAMVTDPTRRYYFKFILFDDFLFQAEWTLLIYSYPDQC